MTTTEDMDRIALMHTLLAIREHETRLVALASSTTPGTCTSVGQEACAAGVVRALEPHDRMQHARAVAA